MGKLEYQNWNEILLPYDYAVEELKIKFKNIRKEFITKKGYSPIEFVTGRTKKVSSIISKGSRLDIQNIEEIEDIAGIRIMCQFMEDIYEVVEIIKKRSDMKIITEKDYVAGYKESGYRSYHVVVKYNVHSIDETKELLCEIQIRTMAMNFWATIEHSLRYKYKENMPDAIQHRLSKAAQAAYKLDAEMAQIREEVLKSQEGFQEESNIVGEIFANIQTLAQKFGEDGMTDMYEEFWELWEDSSVEELKVFNDRLEDDIKLKLLNDI